MFNKTLLQTCLNPRTLCRLSSDSFVRVTISIGLVTWLALGGSPTYGSESIRGPDVVIVAGDNKTVLEFRQNGQLRMIQVIPKRGKPYYLVPEDPTKNNGDLTRADKLLPSWIIASFE